MTSRRAANGHVRSAGVGERTAVGNEPSERHVRPAGTGERTEREDRPSLSSAGETDGRTAAEVTRDGRLAMAAAGQLGLATRADLAACGFGDADIAYRVSTGRLHRKARGVYAVGQPTLDPRARWLAAVLSLGADVWLGFETSAELWKLPVDRRSATIHLVVAGRRLRSRAGIRVHETSRLDAADHVRRDGLPTTGLARTVVDLAAVLGGSELERVVAEARAVHGLTVGQVRAAAERSPGGRGRAVLDSVLAATGGPRRSRSEAEARFLALARSAGLPTPETDVRIGAFRVDALWRQQRVVAEVDGYAFHGGRRAFEADRRRDAELQARGFVVFRVTWRQIVEEPIATVARLSALLATRTE